MYALNLDYISKIAKSKGYGGIKPLLTHLGLHRNTFDRYMKGSPVLPSSVEKVIAALDISIEKATYKKVQNSELAIDNLINCIHKHYPNVSIFLFGSQAREGSRKARKYSDFDLGLYSKQGIIFSDYLKILEIKDDYEENNPQRIDVVNLEKADKDFLINIIPDMRMLVGFEKDFIDLKRKAYGE